MSENYQEHVWIEEIAQSGCSIILKIRCNVPKALYLFSCGNATLTQGIVTPSDFSKEDS